MRNAHHGKCGTGLSHRIVGFLRIIYLIYNYLFSNLITETLIGLVKETFKSRYFE